MAIMAGSVEREVAGQAPPRDRTRRKTRNLRTGMEEPYVLAAYGVVVTGAVTDVRTDGAVPAIANLRA